jgi:poly(3-hydroxybutyrate) depolymerase
MRRPHSWRWLRRIVLIIGVVFLPTTWSAAATAADDARGFINLVFKDDEGEHKYVVFVPQNDTPEKKWPVILFLHGAGERGNDGTRQTTVGLGPLVKARAKTFPFLVVFPQAEDTKGRLLTGWSADSADGKRAIQILEAVEKQFPVDQSRRILTGWSMGGYGTWSIAAAMPKHWSAIVPLAGGGDEDSAKQLKNVPVWAFHGPNDAVIRSEESRRMIAALKSAGGRPRYTETVGLDHDVWKVVYDSDALYAWMLNPKLEETSTADLRVRPGRRPPTVADQSVPFIPAIEIPRAAYVRLGNDVLKALADSIPRVMSREALKGRLNDIYDSTTVEGRTFRVQFSQITYAGSVVRAHVKALGKDRLNIQLGLRNVRLRIGRTYVQGRSRSAVAGPINVVIGHRRPVWLNLNVTPSLKARTLKLTLSSSRFQIQNDNWSVTSPAGVSTQGFGMTRERVSRGLVSGIYGSKARIEREVLAIVPEVISELEKHLAFPEVSKIVNSFWPLPVYRPRVRVLPDGVVTDRDGVSISLGVTVAAIEPSRAPPSPRILKLSGPPLAALPKGTGLQVGVTPGILQPLTDLLIQADVARIHVLDIPEKTFGLFADRAVLSEAIPDLKNYGDEVEIWSELVLAAPLRVLSEDLKEPRTDSDSTVLTFEVPKAIISLAIKTDPESSAWTPYAEFEFQVSQNVTASVVRPNYRSRALRFEWSGDSVIQASGRFAPNYKPRNSELRIAEIQQLFSRGWRAWTRAGPVLQMKVPDVDFGYSKLRLDEVHWSAPHLLIGFTKPGVKITNRSQEPLVYQTRGPYSSWGGPYRLETGKSHVFAISHPLVYRRKVDAGFEKYTLPAGSHSEFRIPKSGGRPAMFQAREMIPQELSAGGGADVDQK